MLVEDAGAAAGAVMNQELVGAGDESLRFSAGTETNDATAAVTPAGMRVREVDPAHCPGGSTLPGMELTLDAVLGRPAHGLPAASHRARQQATLDR